jgi:hypothetical protein
MEPTHITNITHAIQLAVAPVFLLTAIATLINVLNARLGRTIDRRRLLEKMMFESADCSERVAVLKSERALQVHRLHVIYWAILSAVASALLICLVIVGAFIGALLEFEVSRLIAVLFILAVVSMVLALILFLREVYLMIDAHDVYADPLQAKPTLSQERHSSSIK